jgi:hypothetical protein
MSENTTTIPTILTGTSAPVQSVTKTDCGPISPNAQIPGNVALLYSWSSYYYQWSPSSVETPCAILIPVILLKLIKYFFKFFILQSIDVIDIFYTYFMYRSKFKTQ